MEECVRQVADGTESVSKDENRSQRVGRLAFVTKYHF